MLHRIRFLNLTYLFYNDVISISFKHKTHLVMKHKEFIFYFILHFSILILHIKTLKYYLINTEMIKNNCSRLSYSFAAMNLQVLLVLDFYGFTSFYIQKLISHIIIVYIKKVQAILLYITLFYKIGFTKMAIAIVVIQIFSLFYIIFGLKDVYSSAYHQYNMRIGIDLKTIQTNIREHVNESLKIAQFYKMILILFNGILSRSIDWYIHYTYIKLLIYILDYILYRNLQNRKTYYIISILLFGIISTIIIFSFLILGYFDLFNMNIIYAVTEFSHITMFLAQLYLYYEKFQI